MFQEERPHLRALPLQDFQYFTEATHTVWDDSCVRVDHSSYAARPALIGTRVLVRLFEHHLKIRDLRTQGLLRTHTRASTRGSVVLPDNERLFNPSRETRRILAKAKAIGPATDQLCQSLFNSEGRVGQRKLWGIVGLVKRYPRRLIEQACAMALYEGVRSYKQIMAQTERLLAQVYFSKQFGVLAFRSRLASGSDVIDAGDATLMFMDAPGGRTLQIYERHSDDACALGVPGRGDTGSAGRAHATDVPVDDRHRATCQSRPRARCRRVIGQTLHRTARCAHQGGSWHEGT